MTRSVVVVAAFFAMLTAGCSETLIVMSNPKTGEVAQCRAGGGPTLFPIIQSALDKSTAESCAAGYLGAGWKRMN